MGLRSRIAVTLLLLSAAAAYLFFNTGTPHFGRHLQMKGNRAVSIELTLGEQHIGIADPNLCSGIIATLQKARGGGSPHLCPPVGTLAIRYDDGTTNLIALVPGHGFNRLDLIAHPGELYSISRGELFAAFRSAGLLRTNE